MSGSVAGRLAGLLLAAVLVVYPLLMFFMLDEFGVRPLAVLLAALLLTRVLPIVQSSRKNAIALALLIVVFAAVLYLSRSEKLLMAYPAVISLIMLGAFAVTLFHPPSIIERFSRKMGVSVPPQAIPYMRVLTMFWCGFFLLNACVAALLAWQGDVTRWALYNGLVSYLIIGLLIVAELVFRQYYRRRHGIGG